MKINFDQLQNQVLQNTFDTTIGSSSVIRSSYNIKENLNKNDFTYTQKYNENKKQKEVINFNKNGGLNNSNVNISIKKGDKNHKNTGLLQKNNQDSRIRQDEKYSKFLNNKVLSTNLRSYSEIQKEINKKLQKVDGEKWEKQKDHNRGENINGIQVQESKIFKKNKIAKKENQNGKIFAKNQKLFNEQSSFNFDLQQATKYKKKYSSLNPSNKINLFQTLNKIKAQQHRSIQVQKYLKSIQKQVHYSRGNSRSPHGSKQKESFHLRLSHVKKPGCQRQFCKHIVPTKVVNEQKQLKQVKDKPDIGQQVKQSNYSQSRQYNHSQDFSQGHSSHPNPPSHTPSSIFQRLHSQYKRKQFQLHFLQQEKNLKQIQRLQKQKRHRQKLFKQSNYGKNYQKFYDRLGDLVEKDRKKYEYYEKLKSNGSLNKILKTEKSRSKENKNRSMRESKVLEGGKNNNKKVVISQQELNRSGQQESIFEALYNKPTECFIAKTSKVSSQYGDKSFLSTIQYKQLKKSLQKKIGINQISEQIVTLKQSQLLQKIKNIFYNKSKKTFRINSQKIHQLHEQQFILLFDIIRSIELLIQSKKIKSQKQLQKCILQAYQNMDIMNRQELRRLQIVRSIKKKGGDGRKERQAKGGLGKSDTRQRGKRDTLYSSTQNVNKKNQRIYQKNRYSTTQNYNTKKSLVENLPQSHHHHKSLFIQNHMQAAGHLHQNSQDFYQTNKSNNRRHYGSLKQGNHDQKQQDYCSRLADYV